MVSCTIIREERGVTVLHCFGDELWKSGGSTIPNEGFSLKQVYAIGGCEDGDDETSEKLGEQSESPDENIKGIKHISGEVDAIHEMAGLMKVSPNNDKRCVEEDSSQRNIKESKLEAEKDSVDYEDLLLHCSESDSKMMKFLLRSIKYVVKDRCLPMLVSSFWSVLTRVIAFDQNISDGTETLNIKHTRWQKVGTFLSFAQSAGLLCLTSTNGVASVTSIQRQHKLFLAIDGVSVVNPEILRKFCSSPRDSEFESKKREINDSKLLVLQLYKFPKNSKQLFGETLGEHGVTLTCAEVRSVLYSYVESKRFICDDNKRMVSIPRSDPLNQFVFGKRKIKGVYSAEESPRPAVHTSGDSEPDGFGGALTNVLSATSDEYEYSYEGDTSDIRSLVDGDRATVGGVWLGTTGKGENRIDQGLRRASTALIGAPLEAMERPFEVSDKEPSSAPPSVDTGIWKRVHLSTSNINTNVKAKATATKAFRTKPVEKGKTGKYLDDLMEMPPDVLPRDELLNTLLNRLAPYHVIIRRGGGPPLIASGPPPKISINVSMRAGNKLISTLKGYDSFDFDGKEIAKEFQKKFACSASCSQLEVVVQGHRASDLETYLIDSRGVPKQLIDITLGKGVKNKKSR